MTLALLILAGMILGAAAGAAIAVWVMARWFPRVTVHQVVVTPEAIARGLAAGRGIQIVAPPVMVDWTLLHKVVEAEGYVLIGKDEPGAPRRH